jgi:D-threo-aldose 1-dehydrogenase
MLDLVGALELDCLLLASRYTLLDFSALDELLPLCQRRGVAVLAGGVFNSGILADPIATPVYEYVPASADVRARVAEIASLCGGWDVPLQAAALQFPLAHPAVVCDVVGMRSTVELEQNIAMLELPIPAGLWKDLKRRGLLAADAPTPRP